MAGASAALKGLDKLDLYLKNLVERRHLLTDNMKQLHDLLEMYKNALEELKNYAKLVCMASILRIGISNEG